MAAIRAVQTLSQLQQAQGIIGATISLKLQRPFNEAEISP